MIDKILIVSIVLLLIIIMAVIYSACVMSSQCNKTMKQHQSDLLYEKDVEDGELTDLENQTLERLLQLYEEGGVNFVINDGRVVGYEVE